MSVLNHLKELRRRLIYILFYFLFFFVVSFWFADLLLYYLRNSAYLENITWNVFSPGDSMEIYLKCMLLIGISFSFPIIIYNLLAFLKPGMTSQEISATFRFIPFSIIMLIIGFLFSYYILFPSLLNFTSIVNEKLGMTQTYGALEYFKFLFNTVIPITILFQLPIIIFLLTKLGIINPVTLKKSRKMAYFFLIVISVIISPPDFISDLLVCIPLLILYEFSIGMALWVYKNNNNKLVQHMD
jgi:sec-independent protein translocase protein TatC